MKPEYEIPLSDIYEEQRGPHVCIDPNTVGADLQLMHFRKETPHDLVELSDSEVEELVHVLTAYLARRRTGQLGWGRTGVQFEQYRVDEGAEE